MKKRYNNKFIKQLREGWLKKNKLKVKRQKLNKLRVEALRAEELRAEELRAEKLRAEELRAAYLDKLKKKWKRLMKSLDKKDNVIIKYIYIFYKKHIRIIEMSKDIDIYMTDSTFMDKLKELDSTMEIQKLWNFWYPILDLSNIQIEKEYKDIEVDNIPWIIYICLKCNINSEQLSNLYYKLFKREHIYKIIIKSEPLVIEYSNKYSTHMIVYTKRVLEYHDIITNDLSNFDQYKYININILDEIYRNSKVTNSIRCILSDVRVQLEEGLYDDYIIYNYNLLNKQVLMKHELGPRKIKRTIIEMLKLSKLNIRFLLLKSREILYTYLV